MYWYKKIGLILVVILLTLSLSKDINAASNYACNEYCVSHFGLYGRCLGWFDNKAGYCVAGSKGLCSFGNQCFCKGEAGSNNMCKPQTTANDCTAFGTDTNGICRTKCGASPECNGALPSMVNGNPSGDTCAWCDLNCRFKTDTNKPCPNSQCKVGGWSSSNCPNSDPCNDFCERNYHASGSCKLFSCSGEDKCEAGSNGLCSVAHVCCCYGVPHKEGNGCWSGVSANPVCHADGTDSTGKCNASCGASSECSGKAPNSYWSNGNICNWCDECSFASSNSKPCETAECTAKGWDDSSCSNTGGGGGTPPDNGGGGGGGPNPICSPGSSMCSGINKLVCSGDGMSWNNQGPSLECCNDGDCAASKCNGAWKPGAPAVDFSRTGYCCGDDGNTDLGKRFGNYLCVNDNGVYRWILGQEDSTYLSNKLLFCHSDFIFCLDNQGYHGVQTATECQNNCHYYCELNTKTWIDRRTSQFLAKPLVPDQPVDTVKDNMQGSKGCCPAQWCWNGNLCIENQINEACEPYVYELNDVTYRCKNGQWKQSFKAWEWTNEKYGYCPDNSDCFISCQNASNNYKPDMYFSTQPPQCIANGQYILDHFCYNRSWITRTALVATKLVNNMNDHNFKISCGSAAEILNEADYTVNEKPVYLYLLQNCKINNIPVPCVNNFCLIKDLNTNQTIFGTSLNSGLNEGEYAFGTVINIGNCEGPPPSSEEGQEWDYRMCKQNVFYNPYLKAVLYSNKPINLVEDMDGWQAFSFFLVHPINAIINLIESNEVYYVNKITNTKLEFPILKDAPAYGNLYILRDDDLHVEGVFEMEKRINDTFGNYLLIKYTGTPDVCAQINNITSQTSNETKCDKKGNSYYVTDFDPKISYLMTLWNDLTAKFFRK